MYKKLKKGYFTGSDQIEFQMGLMEGSFNRDYKKSKRYRLKHYYLGLCSHCPESVEKGNSTCERHTKINLSSVNKLREERLSKDKCFSCGIDLKDMTLMKDSGICAFCSEKYQSRSVISHTVY